MGTLSEGRNGTKTVNEDFRLVTFDIVADPSTRGAYPTLSESKEYKKDKKIIESTIKNVVGERYFLKLLEMKIDSKLNENKKSQSEKQTAAKKAARKAKQLAKMERERKAGVKNPYKPRRKLRFRPEDEDPSPI
jgi:hypothetical protein